MKIQASTNKSITEDEYFSQDDLFSKEESRPPNVYDNLVVPAFAILKDVVLRRGQEKRVSDVGDSDQ